MTTTLLLLVLAASLGGCLAGDRLLVVERDLAEMKRRLAETERGLAAMRLERNTDTQERLENLGQRLAEQQAALDTFRVEFQSLNGRIEDLHRQQRQVGADLGLVQDDLGIKLSALEERLTQLEGRLTATPAASTATPAPAPAATAPASKPVEGQQTAEEFYQRALKLLREEQQYAPARDAFGGFLQHFPEHELAPNAKYWIGESYFGEQRYENAILQFQDVIQSHPKHPKAAAALLMQAMAFHALGDTGNGQVVLRKLVESFPDSNEAQKAKARLQEWSKP